MTDSVVVVGFDLLEAVAAAVAFLLFFLVVALLLLFLVAPCGGCAVVVPKFPLLLERTRVLVRLGRSARAGVVLLLSLLVVEDVFSDASAAREGRPLNAAVGAAAVVE